MKDSPYKDSDVWPFTGNVVNPPSIVKQNAQKDSNYNPYCMRCSRLVRMVKVEHLYWKCGCGAEHDEREAQCPINTGNQ